MMMDSDLHLKALHIDTTSQFMKRIGKSKYEYINITIENVSASYLCYLRGNVNNFTEM